MTKRKLKSVFEIPLTLELPYQEKGKTKKTKYKLFAMLVHKGVSAYGGHYIAYVEDEK
jgi:ubiquitin C-terminal hydrolase